MPLKVISFEQLLKHLCGWRSAAILRRLKGQGIAMVMGWVGKEPELTEAPEVEVFFKAKATKFVFLEAAKSGGIGTNQRYPVNLMLHNLLPQTHVIKNGCLNGTLGY